MLYRVTLGGESDGFIYVLFEHKSYHDKYVHLQLLEYEAKSKVSEKPSNWGIITKIWPLPMGNLQPPVTRTLLPGTKEVYGQLLLLDFNQPELQPLTAYGQAWLIGL